MVFICIETNILSGSCIASQFCVVGTFARSNCVVQTSHWISHLVLRYYTRSLNVYISPGLVYICIETSIVFGVGIASQFCVVGTFERSRCTAQTSHSISHLVLGYHVYSLKMYTTLGVVYICIETSSVSVFCISTHFHAKIPGIMVHGLQYAQHTFCVYTSGRGKNVPKWMHAPILKGVRDNARESQRILLVFDPSTPR